MLKNLAQTPGCHNGFARNDRHWFAGILIQHIGPETGQRLKTVGGFIGIVRQCQQINCNGTHLASNVFCGINTGRN